MMTSLDSVPRTGGQILVDALRQQGTRTVFCVPGESFLPVLDALYHARADIRLVVCRHESGAANMAEAQAKITGEPGICFVTRGPGASNAAIAVHTAQQDSTPLIVFVGQVSRDALGREAWQEIDYRSMFGDGAKWAAQVDTAARLPEFVNRAFHVATSGRPGPVVLALPEDMLAETASVGDCPRYRRVQAAPQPQALAELHARVGAARRPLVIVGGGGWNAQACEDLAVFVTAFDLPVAAAFRRQDLLDNRLPQYVGEAGLGMDPRLAERIRQADLIVAIGARLGETTTQGYELVSVPRPRQALVHVHADPGELGRVYHADLPIAASLPTFAQAVALLKPHLPVPWSDWTRSAREDYLARLQAPSFAEEGVDLAAAMVHLRESLPPDTIVCNGACNYTLWVQRFWPYAGFRTQLAPTSGTMGYGLPAAIGAKLLDPERTVVCFAGDGCFMMAVQELATAVQYGAHVIVIVANNGMYGSIRMHQERQYPGDVWGTELHNPDFAQLARSFGAHGEVVACTADFPAALQRARDAAQRQPAVIELRMSAQVLTPQLTVGALRQRAGQ